MTGYFGYKKSRNAVAAEKDERFPISKAAKILSVKLGWTQAKTKALLLHIGTSEWHHTSKMYNVTDYYDVSDQWIDDHRSEIDSFEYNPQKQNSKIVWFKCWNIDQSDCRKWDWKFTSRYGNNVYSLSEAIKVLDNRNSYWKNLETGNHKASMRVRQENIDVVERILGEIKRVEFCDNE